MEKRNVTTNLVAALLVVIAVLGYGLISKAGNLEPSAGPAPTMKTLDEVEPRIPIGADTTPGDSNNTYVITQPGSYYLTGNFTSNFRHGILIASDDVRVDLMGYRLWSSYCIVSGNLDFDGIHVAAGLRNIEIRNGTIASDNRQVGIVFYRGFRDGIHAETGVQQLHVKNVCISDSRDDGIETDFLTGHRVENCTVLNNGDYGMYLGWDPYGSVVKSNIVKANGSYGIGCGCGSVVAGNLVEANGDGIIANTGSTITNNTVSYNGTSADDIVYGIYSSDGCIVSGNAIYYNGGSAQTAVYALHAGHKNTISANTVFLNGGSANGNVRGIDADNGCTIIDNTVCENGPGATGSVYGIYTGTYCLVDRNTAYNNNGTNLHTEGGCVLGTNCAP